MLMVAATGDWTKDTPKVEFPAIQQVYRLYGSVDRLEMYQQQAGHNYNQASREAVYRFLVKHMLNRLQCADCAEIAHPYKDVNELRVSPGRTGRRTR